MGRRQIPRQWLVADERTANLDRNLRALPRGSGVLFLYLERTPGKRRDLLRKVRRQARRRGLTLVDEAAGESVRVHDMRELRRAGSARATLLFLSPLFPTRSHAGTAPLPRMRAATLVRLAQVPVVALGGMDKRRYAQVRGLGFAGWAGIDAWAQVTRRSQTMRGRTARASDRRLPLRT